MLMRSTQGPVFVYGNDGDDQLFVGFNRKRLSFMTSMTAFDGGAGANTIQVDDSSSTVVSGGVLSHDALVGLGLQPGANAIHAINLCDASGDSITDSAWVLRLTYLDLPFTIQLPGFTGSFAAKKDKSAYELLVGRIIQRELLDGELTCGRLGRTNCSDSVAARFVGCSMTLEFRGELGGRLLANTVELRRASGFDLAETTYTPKVLTFSTVGTEPFLGEETASLAAVNARSRSQLAGLALPRAADLTLSASGLVLNRSESNQARNLLLRQAQGAAGNASAHGQLTFDFGPRNRFNLLRLAFRAQPPGLRFCTAGDVRLVLQPARRNNATGLFEADASAAAEIAFELLDNEPGLQFVAIPLLPHSRVLLQLAGTCTFAIELLVLERVAASGVSVPGLPYTEYEELPIVFPSSVCRESDTLGAACSRDEQALVLSALGELFPGDDSWSWEWSDAALQDHPFRLVDVTVTEDGRQSSLNIVQRNAPLMGGALTFHVPADLPGTDILQISFSLHDPDDIAKTCPASLRADIFLSGLVVTLSGSLGERQIYPTFTDDDLGTVTMQVFLPVRVGAASKTQAALVERVQFYPGFCRLEIRFVHVPCSDCRLRVLAAPELNPSPPLPPFSPSPTQQNRVPAIPAGCTGFVVQSQLPGGGSHLRRRGGCAGQAGPCGKLVVVEQRLQCPAG